MSPIVFLTSGTRGDVQPVIALARGLQTKEHEVRVAAPPEFRTFVELHGIPFTAVDGNPSNLMTAKSGEIPLTFDGNLVHSARSSLHYLNEAQTVYAQMLSNAWKACEDASVLVIGLPTIWGTSIAERLNIPCFGAFLQAISPTNEFPCPVLPSTLSLGGAYNKLTYYTMGLATYLPWQKVINDWRKSTLGLKPLPAFGASPRPFGRVDKFLYGFSEHVVPRPRDWDENSIITGYWPLVTDNWLLDPSLDTFIKSGTPPVYFGFGSPGTYQPDKIFECIVEATCATDTRAVTSLPKGTHVMDPPEHIYILRENVPHDWLFPQMAGAVHHGGAGTTGSALMAGIPSLIAPIAVDQFFWGSRVFALGMGPKPIPHRELRVANLVEGLKKMKEGRMKEEARKLGKILRREEGVTCAVQEMEMLIKR